METCRTRGGRLCARRGLEPTICFFAQRFTTLRFVLNPFTSSFVYKKKKLMLQATRGIDATTRTEQRHLLHPNSSFHVSILLILFFSLGFSTCLRRANISRLNMAQVTPLRMVSKFIASLLDSIAPASLTSPMPSRHCCRSIRPAHPIQNSPAYIAQLRYHSLTRSGVGHVLCSPAGGQFDKDSLG